MSLPKGDPLSLLREFTVARKPITLVNATGNLVTELTEASHVVFKDETQTCTFPRTTPTNYRRGASDEMYTLETLLFLLQRAHQSVAEYSLEGAQKHIPIVSILDKRSVLEYLTGSTSNSANIVYQPTEANKRPRDDATDDQQDEATKRHKNTPQLGRPDENEMVRLIISRERLARTTASILRGKKSFANIQKIGASILLKSKSKDEKAPAKKPDQKQSGAAPPTSSSSRSGTATTTTSSLSQNKPRSSTSRTPIIVVPAALTSMLTMYNAKQFLEDQSFVDSLEIRNKGDPKPARLAVEHRKKQYHILDNADNLKPDDWDRVIAVFTAGAEWQFKRWKWSKPIELFAHVKGFHLKWADEQPKENITSWNVEVFSLNRHQRHGDRATVTELWDHLHGWCLKNKPHLAH
ncbi:accessory factor associated with RNA polymerase II [Modicella reniformis]|uniref:Accessory factor associated with RNA polymerase II n=1 Tax=Modicella reniformis TaxID=1440133 RepID=A0A9P6MGS2_9FUNG|nr:accessory factor associated with RNA polymerase II [Modicella reniformis]